ncbi:DUF4422 domain-containing protein [Breznakiellaceae bacterium SP9]
MPDLRIFVTHSAGRTGATHGGSVYSHVLGGAALAGDDSSQKDLVRDDTGENISRKNPSYCELTVQYWAWKNIKADYYGFCHYRRYFCFNPPEGQKPDKHNYYYSDFFDEKAVEQFALDNTEIIRFMGESELALTLPEDVTESDYTSVYDQYEKCSYLHSKDLGVLVSVIHDLFPEYDNAAKTYLEGRFAYFCNMFIMKKELFHRYSAWLFAVLEECKKRIDTANYSEQEDRVTGMFGERCLGIFYTYLQQNEKTKAVLFPKLLIYRPDVGILPTPHFKDPVTIITASNTVYVPYLAVMLTSLLEHIQKDRNYEIFILHSEITIVNQGKIKDLASSYPNVIIRFYDMSMDTAPFSFGLTSYFSTETYYRLLAPWVFHHYDKALYIDPDTVIMEDVSILFDIDIGNHLLGATCEPGAAGEINRKDSAMAVYLSETLGLKNPKDYFMAGVMVLNLNAFREFFLPGQLAEKAASQTFDLLDQDVLNSMCQGRVFLLPMTWNTCFDCSFGLRLRTARLAPKAVYHEYLEARKHPKIIHFAGTPKPWTDPSVDFAEEFWAVARRTPYYETILNTMTVKNAISKANESISLKQLMKKAFYKQAKCYANLFFPQKTFRRQLVKKLYHFLVSKR